MYDISTFFYNLWNQSPKQRNQIQYAFFFLFKTKKVLAGMIKTGVSPETVVLIRIS